MWAVWGRWNGGGGYYRVLGHQEVLSSCKPRGRQGTLGRGRPRVAVRVTASVWVQVRESGGDLSIRQHSTAFMHSTVQTVLGAPHLAVSLAP